MITANSAFSAALANPNRTPNYRLRLAGREYCHVKLKQNYHDECALDSPVVVYRFGESSGTTAEDESGNNLDGTYQNTPTLGATGALTGDPNTAITLNGTDEYVSRADHALLDLGTDTFSIEAFVKATAFAANQCITSKGINGYVVGILTTGAVFFDKGSVATLRTSSISLTAGQWHHVVVTKTGSTAKIYVDGVDVTSFSADATIEATATELTIGRYHTSSLFLGGSIDEFRLYATALSAARVLAHYEAGKANKYYTAALPYMHPPSGFSMEVEPDKGRSTFGVRTVVLEDINGEITDLIGEGIAGQTAYIDIGFDEIVEDAYLTDFTGIVESVRLTPTLGAYEIGLRSVNTLLNVQVFEVAATRLNGSLAAGASSMTVDDTTFFLSAGYLRIDDELIQYSGKTATTFTGLTRAIDGTTDATHADNSGVNEMIRTAEAHPFDIAETAMTNTDKTGASIPAARVDSTGIAAAKTALGSTLRMRFWIDARQNLKQWLEDQICAVTGAYLVVTNEGKISIKLVTEPEDDDSVETLDHDCITVEEASDPASRPEIEWDGNLDRIYNKISIGYDWNPITGRYENYYEDEDEISISVFGERKLSLTARGIRTGLTGTATLLATMSSALLLRYRNSAPLVSVNTFLTKSLVEIGDVVSLTSSLLPDRFTHARGITDELFEVVQKEPRYNEGKCRFVLLWTSFNVLSRDSFNRDDTDAGVDTDLGTDVLWDFSTNTTTGPEVRSNQLFLGDDGSSLTGQIVLMRTQETGQDQYSELEFVSELDGICGPGVRLTGGFGNATGYAALYDPVNTRVQIRKYFGEALGTPGGTQIGSNHTVTLTAGDKLGLKATGTVTADGEVSLTLLINGVSVMTTEDTSGSNLIVSGAVGAISAVGANKSITWDNWRGGDLGWG